MSDDDMIVVETAERIFRDLADPQTIIAAKDERWKAPLLDALADNGLLLAWVDETHGGAGVSLEQGFGVLRAAGRAALAVPLAETMLAGWMLARGGITAPQGMMTVAPSGPRGGCRIDGDGTISGIAHRVPFARQVEFIAVAAPGATGKSVAIALVKRDACTIRQGHSLAGEASDDVVFDRVQPEATAEAPGDFSLRQLALMGAAARCQQIAGALETLLELSVRYAGERIAFEKKIAKYQAVQHNLARLAGEVAAAVSAANSAAQTIATLPLASNEALLEIAAAKIRCGEAAGTATGIAHQVHGAIGYTDEHVLHRYSLRALSWRDDFGSESHWAAELGRFVTEQGADELWPLVASR